MQKLDIQIEPCSQLADKRPAQDCPLGTRQVPDEHPEPMLQNCVFDRHLEPV